MEFIIIAIVLVMLGLLGFKGSDSNTAIKAARKYAAESYIAQHQYLRNLKQLGLITEERYETQSRINDDLYADSIKHLYGSSDDS